MRGARHESSHESLGPLHSFSVLVARSRHPILVFRIGSVVNTTGVDCVFGVGPQASSEHQLYMTTESAIQAAWCDLLSRAEISPIYLAPRGRSTCCSHQSASRSRRPSGSASVVLHPPHGASRTVSASSSPNFSPIPQLRNTPHLRLFSSRKSLLLWNRLWSNRARPLPSQSSGPLNIPKCRSSRRYRDELGTQALASHGTSRHSQTSLQPQTNPRNLRLELLSDLVEACKHLDGKQCAE